MINQSLFSAAGNAVLAGWLLLAAAAAMRSGAWRDRLLALGGLWVPLMLSAAYLFLFLLLSGKGSEGSLFSLSGIAAKFADRDHLFLLYLEVLTLSLFVGRWIIVDAEASGVRRWTLLLALPLQFLLGPIGLLAYHCLKVAQVPLRR